MGSIQYDMKDAGGTRHTSKAHMYDDPFVCSKRGILEISQKEGGGTGVFASICKAALGPCDKSCGRESLASTEAERDMEKIVFLFWVFSTDEISSPQD